MDKKVLIVDDDPLILRLLSKYVSEAGFKVLEASNGIEALRVVLSEAPPIVMTDWNMPGMDGLELTRQLRTHPGVRFVYVILVTAESDYEKMLQAFEAGADDFLMKPVGRPELLARLRSGEHIARLESDIAKRTREIHRLNAEMAIANEKLALANDKLTRMATTDELTGLLNRREAMTRLAALWEAEARYGHPFSCIMLDIDHFKKVNDTYGHAVGDKVLRETANVIASNVRMTDIVCRVGGEEFLVLCPNVGVHGAAICSEHIRDAMEKHAFNIASHDFNVTISLGVAERRPEMLKTDDLLKEADVALYASKQHGRNRVTLAGDLQDAAELLT